MDAQSLHLPKYQRIVLKLSGEVLRNEQTGEPIDGHTLKAVCQQIKTIYDLGVEIAIVIGGGNIFRGLKGHHDRGIDRTTGDYMGMMATVVNGLAFMDCLEKCKYLYGYRVLFLLARLLSLSFCVELFDTWKKSVSLFL